MDEQDDSDIEEIESGGRDATNRQDTARNAERDGEVMIPGRGTLDEESVQWWESWRKRARKETPSRGVVSSSRRKKRKLSVKVEDSEDISVSEDKDRPRKVDEFEVDEQSMHEDLRILIKVRYLVFEQAHILTLH